MRPLRSLAIVISVTACLSGAVADDTVPRPHIPSATQGDACVEPTAVMRRDHMEFLNHQRDDVVLDGVRRERHSLSGCIDCHSQRGSDGAPIPIDAKGQFCETCHAYAAVKLDCFSCHSAVVSSRDHQ